MPIGHREFHARRRVFQRSTMRVAMIHPTQKKKSRSFNRSDKGLARVLSLLAVWHKISHNNGLGYLWEVVLWGYYIRGLQ
ncbi:hypothetical protein H5410_032762 [Solanum commersonii]|uniref:Uncharacterized protein n=1 Tax=Solanum commersonii TaxID=4109 RepID=A0A9J5YNU9_SOLCO|nr:hypothetical protein H5410_032762 [Solanum commersonii]